MIFWSPSAAAGYIRKVGFVLAYLRLYGRCLSDAFTGIAKNLWTLLLPVALFLAFAFLSVPISAALGRAGGILLSLILTAIYSCYLYFTGGVVAHRTMTLRDLKASFLTYFWSVMGLLFALWIAELVIKPLLGGMTNGQVIWTGLQLVGVIILNPAPEVIYTKGTRGSLDTIQTCIKFIQDNWIEWFIPNGLILAGAWLLATRLPPFPGDSWVLSLAGAALFHVFMVFRGHLFEALDGSTHRQRVFKYGRRSSS